MDRGVRVPPVVRRIVRWLSKVSFAAAVVVVLGMVAVLTVLPRLTGGAALTVLTGSMTPDIPVGSVVLIRPVDPGTLGVGDVATYQVSPESRALVTHRVIDVRGTGDDTRYVFKGDANRGPDAEPVPPQAVRGEVWFHVPWLGSIRDAVQGMNLILMLAPPLLGVYAIGLVLSGARDRRRRHTEPAPVLDRRLVAARFPRVSESGTSTDPDALARRWGGVVFAADRETVTVLVTSDETGLERTIASMHDQHPAAMWSGGSLDARAWHPLAPAATQPPVPREVADVPV